MRIMAIDPGTKRLGVALSDSSGMVAMPLNVIEHKSRHADAETILGLADKNNADLIVIGQAMDGDGAPTPQGRSAARLAGALRKNTKIPVELWDESGSTQAARSAKIIMGSARKKRRGHLDEIAATVILQSYIDAHFGKPAHQINCE
ncbi:MAG: Holliday junction resolvase RuvX [Chloroflexi bacterium]|nr:Holliday junction resolvase RuvX [Chloroflexota bacterium]